MSPAGQRQLIQRFYDEMWNRFDKSLFVEILDPMIRFRGSLGQVKVGHDEFGEYVDVIAAFAPDFHNEVVETITEEARTFARLSYRGTHRGEVFGIEPTGRSFEYAGAAVFTFSRTQIIEVWVLGDLYGLLQQLRGEAGWWCQGTAAPAGGVCGEVLVPILGASRPDSIDTVAR